MAEYTASIFKAVKQYLPSESEARRGVSCKVSFRQNRSGYVQEIKVIKCSDGTTSNLLFQAIAKASPMPQPTRPEDFQEEVTITYAPQP
ncbi:TonB C-terminal domain-containing protein [Pseudidiomarina aquimaris]